MSLCVFDWKENYVETGETTSHEWQRHEYRIQMAWHKRRKSGKRIEVGITDPNG